MIQRRCRIVTTLKLDKELVKEAVKIGKFKTQEQMVNAALAEYVRRHKQASILELAGKVEYYPDYDYKKVRSRKRK